MDSTTRVVFPPSLNLTSLQNFRHRLHCQPVTPNNEPLKPLTAFMEDLVQYLNERSGDAYIWLLTIGIFTFGYGILALIAIPFFRLLP